MLTHERKALLLDRLGHDGRIVAKELATELDLSEDTVRRDLRALAAEGKLQRVHGGALPASPAIVALGDRARIASDSKARVARKGAEVLTSLVIPGQLVFLDGGTTSAALVGHLSPDLAITVATHSPTIASLLIAHPTIAVELIGGRLFKHSAVAVGAVAANAIRRLRPDLFVMGVTGIHPETGATTGDAEEAEIKSLIAAQSADTMVLASKEKLGAASPYQIVPIGDVAIVVIDGGTPPEAVRALRLAGPDVIEA